jgi:hypothetical protein
MGHIRLADDPICPDKPVGLPRRPSLIGAVLVVLALLGCDTFFECDLLVTDCMTGQPLQGVAASSHLDDGFGEEDHHATTDMAGRVVIGLNEPDGVVVTVTLTKVGYQDWTKQFRGEPPKPYSVCLQPALP